MGDEHVAQGVREWHWLEQSFEQLSGHPSPPCGGDPFDQFPSVAAVEIVGQLHLWQRSKQRAASRAEVQEVDEGFLWCRDVGFGLDVVLEIAEHFWGKLVDLSSPVSLDAALSHWMQATPGGVQMP